MPHLPPLSPGEAQKRDLVGRYLRPGGDPRFLLQAYVNPLRTRLDYIKGFQASHFEDPRVMGVMGRLLAEQEARGFPQLACMVDQIRAVVDNIRAAYNVGMAPPLAEPLLMVSGPA